MRIAIASGKGGTGKTTIAVNLAALLAKRERTPVTYADCDVEEPNGHIFLAPWIDTSEAVTVPVPVIDVEACTLCGACSSFCQFKALATISDRVMVFDELCHGCGGCSLVCGEKAISERQREVGTLETGATVVAESGAVVDFIHGRLRVKEVQAVPVVKAVKRRLPEKGIAVIDAPPGTSCPMVEAVRGADFVLLVTEPTPFGLHDLELAVDTVRELGIDAAVLLNQSDIGDDRVRAYCEKEGIEIVAEIPHSREIAEAYSRGKLLAGRIESFTLQLNEMIPRILDMAASRV